MRFHALLRISTASIVCAVLSSCQRAGPEATGAPTGTSIQITKISPDTSAPLHPGDRVNLEVTTNYLLSAESGFISLVVQAADNSVILNQTEVVTKGSGTVTLKSSFTVPDTNSVLVFVPIGAQGQSSTSTVDTRGYKVAK